MSFVYGKVTIDLGGHTFTCNESHDRGLFYADAKRSHKTEIVIKNGTFLVGKNPIIIFGGWNTSGYDYASLVKTFSFTFDRVTFRLLEDADATYLISGFKNGSNAPVNTEITLNECVFDLATNRPKKIVLFAAGDSTGNVVGKVTVIGGYVEINELKRVTLQEIGNPRSEVVFLVGDEGYITLSVPSNATLPTEVFKTNIGDAVFTLWDESDGRKIALLELQ